MPVKLVSESDGLVWDLRNYDVRDNAFGLDVLHQDKVWINRDGETVLLAEMELSYRANLLRFLRRRAVGLEWRDALAMLGSPLGAPRGEAACDAVDNMLDERVEDPAAWLESTALVTWLRESLRLSDGPIDEVPY